MTDEEQFEAICAEVHNGWWEQSRKAGRHAPNDCPSRPARSGKFAKHCPSCHPDMYPYEELSEEVKEYDRVTVRAVLAAQTKLAPPDPSLEKLAREIERLKEVEKTKNKKIAKLHRQIRKLREDVEWSRGRMEREEEDTELQQLKRDLDRRRQDAFSSC